MKSEESGYTGDVRESLRSLIYQKHPIYLASPNSSGLSDLSAY